MYFEYLATVCYRILAEFKTQKSYQTIYTRLTFVALKRHTLP